MKIHAGKQLAAFALAPYLLLAAPSFAQNTNIAPGAQPMSEEQLAALDVRASKLIGKEVKDTKGEKIGEIKDMVVDVANSKVHYTVLSMGGVLGLGDKLLTFPVNAYKPGKGGEDLVLNVDREKLKKAPGFSPNKWPDWNEGTYRGSVDRFFFKKDELQRTAEGARLTRASDVLGKGIRDRAGYDAGSIADLVVNLGNGQIRYAVMEFDKALSPQGKLVALPLSAFQFPTRPDIEISLLMDRDRVDMARAFDKNSWPDLKSANVQKDMGNANAGTAGQGAQAQQNSGSQNTSSGASGASGASGSSGSSGASK